MNNLHEIKRCAIYARKSTDHGMEQKFTSIDAQVESCMNYITAHASEGWIHVSTYTDVAQSGGTMDRPGVKELLEETREGCFDIIVIYKLDRISRSIRDFANLLHDLEDLGVSLVIVTQNFDSGTPMGRLCLNFLSSFAEFERAMTRDRISDKARILAEQGLWNAGRPPFGYVLGEKRSLVIEKCEAETVQRIFAEAIRGITPHDIADLLNRNNAAPPRVRSNSRAKWDAYKVTRVLQRRLYAGFTTTKDGREFPGRHTAIVTDEEWEKANSVLKAQGALKEKKQRGKHRDIVYPLAGIIRCPVCGEVLSGTYALSHGYINRYYICRRHKSGSKICPFKGLPATAVERAVAQQLASLANDINVVLAIKARLPQLTNRDITEALSNVDMLADRLSDVALGELFKALYKSVVVNPDSETMELERYTA